MRLDERLVIRGEPEGRETSQEAVGIIQIKEIGGLNRGSAGRDAKNGGVKCPRGKVISSVILLM